MHLMRTAQRQHGNVHNAHSVYKLSAYSGNISYLPMIYPHAFRSSYYFFPIGTAYSKRWRRFDAYGRIHMIQITILYNYLRLCSQITYEKNAKQNQIRLDGNKWILWLSLSNSQAWKKESKKNKLVRLTVPSSEHGLLMMHAPFIRILSSRFTKDIFVLY